jgi:hypothetical protein
MPDAKNKATRWQFSLHGAFVTITLLAVAMAIGCQWCGPFVTCFVMAILSPLFVAVYISVMLAEEWIVERMSRKSPK